MAYDEIIFQMIIIGMPLDKQLFDLCWHVLEITYHQRGQHQLARDPPWPFIRLSLLIWQRIGLNTHFLAQQKLLDCCRAVKINVNYLPAPVTKKVNIFQRSQNQNVYVTGSWTYKLKSSQIFFLITWRLSVTEADIFARKSLAWLEQY